MRGVITALDLVGAVRRKAVENLAWAFAYNSVLIPVAAGALSWAGIVLGPEIAGLAMAMSSVTVSAWAQTLRRWTPRGVWG